MADDVTAILAAVKEHIALAAAADLDADALNEVYAALVQLACVDSPLLVAAVEAVLKAADSAEPAMYETGVGPREPIAWNLDPAKVREAIRAALSGKKAGDG